MSKEIIYENRYGNKYQFVKQDDGNVLMLGDLGHHRTMMLEDGNTIGVVDPSGGPYLERGQMLSHIVKDDSLNVIIDSFERIDGGYLIKTKPHVFDPNDMSHLKERWELQDEMRDNKRMNIIGQNGNDGIHYDRGNEQSYGDEDVDEGEWDDQYWGAV